MVGINMQSSECQRLKRISEMGLKEMHLIGKYIIFMGSFFHVETEIRATLIERRINFIIIFCNRIINLSINIIIRPNNEM